MLALRTNDIAALMAKGDVTVAEVEKAAIDYKREKVDPVSGKDASAAYAMLCQTHRLGAEGGASVTYVTRQFAEDCIEDGLTPHLLRLGCKKWRRKDTAFAPTYGQFIAEIKSEISNKHYSAQRYQELQALIQVGRENV